MIHPHPVRSLLIVLTGLALLATACGSSAAARPARTAATTEPSAADRKATVDATGKVRAVPDQLVARLAVQTAGPTAAGVLSDANLRARAVLDQLKRQGVDAKDVQTTQVSLGPTFDKKGNITGFAANNSIQVTLRKLSIAGRQLDAVVRTPGDAARLESVSLGFNNEDKLLTAARTDAVRRARAQAKEMVGVVNADLGAVQSITEARSDAPVFARQSASLAASDSAVPIAPGTQELTVTVHVVFGIG